MTQDEIAALILDGLYERRNHSSIHSLVEIAQEKGITDLNVIGRAANYLDRVGLLDHYDEESDGEPEYLGILNSFGIQLYEQHGGGRRLIAAIHNPQTSPGSVFIQGQFSNSAIAVHSQHVRQSVEIGEPSGVVHLVESLVDAIRGDRSLTEEEQGEALDVAEALKAEVEKDHPSSGVVKSLLKGLAAIAVAAEYVEKIREALGL